MAKTYSGREIERGLTKKGFILLGGRRDHRRLCLVVDGDQTPITTKVSHSRKDVRRYIFKKIAEQCKLSVEDLRALLECPLRKEDYAERVRTQLKAHRLSWPPGTRLLKPRSSPKKLPPQTPGAPELPGDSPVNLRM